MVHLLSQHEEASTQMEINDSFNWLMKRLLLLCLKQLDRDNNINEVFLTAIHVFAKNANVLEYLVTKGKSKY